MFNSLVLPKVAQHNATSYSRTGLLEEVVPKIYTQTYTNLKTANKRKSTQQLQGLDSPLKSQRLTGQLLADKVIPWRLKLQELFFSFFLKEVVPVSPENWGEGRTSALAFMEPRPAQTKSSPKREAVDGGWEREQRRRPQAHKNTHVENEIQCWVSFVNRTTRARLGQTFVFKFCPLR